MKYVGGKILRLVPVADPARDIRVHPFEIVLVKLGEADRVALRRLDQLPLRPVFRFDTASTALRPELLAPGYRFHGRPFQFRFSPSGLQCGITRHTRLYLYEPLTIEKVTQGLSPPAPAPAPVAGCLLSTFILLTGP